MGGLLADTLAPPASRAERWRVWRWRHRQGLLAFAILTPLGLYLLLFTWVPILVMAAISVTEWNIVQWPPKFVGLGNYLDIFTDPYYHKVMRTTAIFSGAVLLLELSIGFGIALMLNERIKGRTFFRMVWYLPVVLSGAVLAQTLLVFLYPNKLGALNSLL